MNWGRHISMISVAKMHMIFGLLGILLVIVLVAAACGAAATATPEPVDTGDTMSPTEVPSEPDQPEPTDTTTLRPREEWTETNPATREELEAELEKYRGRSISVLDGGGAWQAAHRKAYYIPFNQQFGIDIVEDSTNIILAKFRAAVDSSNLTYDVAAWGNDAIGNLANSGHLEELDYSVIDIRNHREEMVSATKPYAAGGGDIYATVFAYTTESFPETGPQPKTAADFFDIEKFPGKRAMWEFWLVNPNFAYLASHPELYDSPPGLESLSSLTDEQMEDAWAFLEEFVDNAGPDFITWSGGSDCPALLIAGELDLCTTWNGRIYDAVTAEDAPLEICWECGTALDGDYYFVPNGLKAQDPEKYELVQLFLAWMSLPEINAQESLYIPYGPVNSASIPLLAGPEWDHIRDFLPTAPQYAPYVWFQDSVWAASITDASQERWQAILGK